MPNQTTLNQANPAIAAAGLPEHGRVRTVIECITPQVDGGRFAAKRVVGDVVRVEADVFTDGHDAVLCRVLYRRAGDTAYASAPMQALVNDRFAGSFTATQVGRWEYSVEGWVDHFETWRRDLRKRKAAGQDLSLEFLRGEQLAKEAAARANGEESRWLAQWATRIADTALDPEQRYGAALDASLSALVRRYPDLDLLARHEPWLPLTVDRERARYSTWYELFPRSCAPEPGRHGTLRDVAARLPELAEHGLRRAVSPADPSHRRDQPQGRQQRRHRPARRARQPLGHRLEATAATRACIPQLGTLDDLRFLVAEASAPRHRAGTGHRLSVQPGPSLCSRAPGVVPASGPTARSSTPRIRPRSTRTSIRSTSSPREWRELWLELKSVLRLLDRPGRAHLPRRQPAHQALRVLGMGDRRGQARAPRRHLPVRGLHPAQGDAPAGQARVHPVLHLLRLAQHARGAEASTSPSSRRAQGASTSVPTSGPTPPTSCPSTCSSAGAPHSWCGWCWPPRWRRATESTARPSSCSSTSRASRAARSTATPRSTRSATGTCDRPDSLRDFVARVNAIRRDNPALQSDWSLRFHPVDNESLLCYSKTSPDGTNMVFIVVNLDPHHTQSGWVELPLEELGLDATRLVPGPRPALRRPLPVARRAQLRGARPAADAGAHLPPAPPGAQRAGLRLLHVRTRAWTGTRGFSSLPTRRPPAGTATRCGSRTPSCTKCTCAPICDADNDGVGDFAGLTSKLDYIQELGVNTIWLLPFYPSPQRDDGYDIADYHNVHPQYGTRQDFRAFVREAHRRGLRGHHRAGHQPHLGPASVVPGRAPRAARLVQAQLLRVERRPGQVLGHAHHLHRHRKLQLDLGRGGEGLLLAPLLQPPARPELRQPAGAQGGDPHHALLARHGGGRIAAGRHPLPGGARGHQQREPAADPCGGEADPAGHRRALRRPRAARRGQPVAGGRARLLRRRRRMPHGLPLPADAAHVHGDRPAGPPSHRRDHAADPRHPRQLPVGDLPAQPRRAHAGDGDQQRARLHVHAPTLPIRARASTWASAGGSRR